MSQSLEVSPLSDTKMDISENTASQESLGSEPNLSKSINEKLQFDGETESSKTLVTSKTTTSTTKPKPLLDNRDNNLDNENTISTSFDTTLRSGLTLVNKHPLMSPPPNTENEQRHQTKFNYPDLVPEIDQPLRLNPQSSETFTDMDNSNNTRRKIPVLRESSPDFLSSGSEPDLSQFQATVAPSFETVALVSNIGYKTSTISSSKPALRRKIPVSADLLSDDISSLDTISNQSFDDDLDPNLASLSPSSSVLDEHGFSDKEDAITPTVNNTVEPLPVYTAAEERRDSRNWQKITLPDGKTREIDMKVIDPYKRVLSHGGYLKAGGNNAIVIFSACHLPDRSRTDYHYVMDNLFLYVVKTLEQLVTEDYVLVYLHGGSDKGNVPPFPWLKKCYQLIDRRLRKSLKNLYLVHPTFWLKSLVWMSRPFISAKFWKKMVYVKSLEELYTLVKVEKASIPDKVKNYETKFT